jgi:hypothetical protein
MTIIRCSRLTISALLIAAFTGCAGKKAEPAPTPVAGTAAPAASVGTTAPAPVTAPATAEGTITSTGGGPSIVLPKPPKARVDQHLITRDAILSTQYTNLYDVIQALRSNWLRIKAPDSFGKTSVLQVYLDTQRLSGVDELRQMAPTNIQSVRYYDPIEASARWGLDHGAGALYVMTAKR